MAKTQLLLSLKKNFRNLLLSLMSMASIFLWGLACATTNDTINQSISQEHAIEQKNNAELKTLIHTSLKNARAYENRIPVSTQVETNQKSSFIEEHAFLFVSFSMPDAMLQQFIIEAKQYRIPVVIRGLIHNSMKETMMKTFSLMHKEGEESFNKDERNEKNKKGGIQINPRLFEEFSIKAVPAFVIARGVFNCPKQQSCPVPQFDVIYGSLSLKEDFLKIAEHGTIGNSFAEHLLKANDA